MGNFFQGVFQVFFLIGYVVLFVVTILILKPFRYHKRRRGTTILLKVSYLLYLLSFLVFSYLLLFGKKDLDSADKYDTLFNIHFLFFLSSTLIPNVGIMIRRKIKHNRIEYNILVTIISLLYFVYLTYLSISQKWAIM